MRWKLSILVIFGFIKFKGAQGLNCMKCGVLSEDPLSIQDCLPDTETSVRCSAGEYCLTYVRNFKFGSEPVRGCYPQNQTLPGLVKRLSPSPSCQLQPQGPSPVKYCLCDTDNCNSLDSITGKDHVYHSLSMRDKDFIFPFDNSTSSLSAVGGGGGPLGGPRPRAGRQRRVQCYQCGSLFNRNSPACDKFNPLDKSQITYCNEGEACLLYTWRKSKTEIGSYRECFTTSILLGHPDQPVRPKPKCEPGRTQKDSRSTIRACLCTDDLCNILPNEVREAPRSSPAARKQEDQT